MVRTKIGEAVTDSNGIAVFEYTGTGAGKLNVGAESGSLQSETYEILDAIFYDVGTGSTPNTNWYNYGSLSTSSDDTGTTVSKSATGNGYYVANQNNISDYVFTAPFCCEFEIVSVSSVRFQVLHNNQNISLSDGDKIKFTIKDGKYTLTKNDVTSNPVNVSETTEQLRFQMMGVSSVKYKDFKVYPI